MKPIPTAFEGQSIRRLYDEVTDTWWFSVIDIVQILTNSENARDYWFKMKQRVKAEDGAELSTFCRQLKLPAADGKQRLTDCATAESLLRIVQSIPSPKAEPIKLWLARVGYERMQEIADPAQALDRARQTWAQQGRSEKWIQQRMTGQETRNKLTDYWSEHGVEQGREFAKVQEALRPLIARFYGDANVDYVLADGEGSPKSGREFYNALSAEPRGASEMLRDAGIPGLRYLDGNSRGNGEGSHNFVIWDEALLTPQKARIQAYYQSAMSPTQAAMQQWQHSLANLSPRNLDYAPKLGTPAVLRALGVSASQLELPTRYLLAIREKHPDVPAKVFENLPALLSNPLLAYAHRDGGLNVVIDAQSTRGAPIVVGVRDGRIRTVTPLDASEGQTPQERIARAVESTYASGGKVYARNEEALAKAEASLRGGTPETGSVSSVRRSPSQTAPGLIPLHRDSCDRRNTILREHLVKRHGEDFYQGSGARGAFSPERLTISLLKGADLSTVLHEGGHFFLENDIALASELHRPPAMASAD